MMQWSINFLRRQHIRTDHCSVFTPLVFLQSPRWRILMFPSSACFRRWFAGSSTTTHLSGSMVTNSVLNCWYWMEQLHFSAWCCWEEKIPWCWNKNWNQTPKRFFFSIRSWSHSGAIFLLKCRTLQRLVDLLIKPTENPLVIVTFCW